jgi:ADP-ribosyl-[dinitrogen reductase] hydrolase
MLGMMMDSKENVRRADRMRGMVWGQFLGDAAALGSHWIYNLTELKEKFPAGLEGFESPGPGHYHAGKSAGDLTHYGDAALVLLESLAETGGFDAIAYGSRFLEMMAPGKYSGYLDSATRGTYENFLDFQGSDSSRNHAYTHQNGADDDQLATASSLAPLLVWHHGDADLGDRVEALTRVRQNNDRAVAYMQVHARLLGELLDGRDFHTAFHRLEEEAARHPQFGAEFSRKFSAAIENKHKSFEDAVLVLGQSCPLISSFPSALVAALKESENFETAILGVLRGGGDNAGRAALVGAWVGAIVGESGLPARWISKLNAREKIAAALDAAPRFQER